MKAFIAALIALVVIAFGANQILMQVVPSAADAGTSTQNVRLSD